MAGVLHLNGGYTTGVGVGFPIPLVAICALDLTYPHRHITYFRIFHGEGFELPRTMAGREVDMGRDGF